MVSEFIIINFVDDESFEVRFELKNSVNKSLAIYRELMMDHTKQH